MPSFIGPIPKYTPEQIDKMTKHLHRAEAKKQARQRKLLKARDAQKRESDQSADARAA